MSKYKKIRSYPTNGLGERIYNPKAYYKAVSEDRYGYSRNRNNSYKVGYRDGYSHGYVDGYVDGYVKRKKKW